MFRYPQAKTKSGKPKVSRKTKYDPVGMRDLIQKAIDSVPADTKIVFCIERQWPRPTDSKHVVQTVAAGYAVWTTVAALMQLDIVEVSPAVWKPRYVPIGADKSESIAICKKLFPAIDLELVRDSDRAEAVLIADYVRRKQTNKPFVLSPSRKGSRNGDQQSLSANSRTRRRRRGHKLSMLFASKPTSNSYGRSRKKRK